MESGYLPRCNARTTRSAAPLGGEWRIGQARPAVLVLGRRSRRTLESDFSILRSTGHFSEIPTTKNLPRTGIAGPEAPGISQEKHSPPGLSSRRRWGPILGFKITPIVQHR